MKFLWWLLPANLSMVLLTSGCGESEDCTSSQTECDGICVNVYDDANNCGTCGSACGASQICSGGDCLCADGSTACGGVCCPEGQTCSNSSCQACGDREACNGVDDDCDGEIDEGLTQPCNNPCGAGTETCIAGSWSNCTAPASGAEVCDGEDNDCDGQTDEEVSVTLYIDTDNDGYGDLNDSIQGCPGVSGYTDNPDDCDDTNENINPGAAEDCEDSLDNNCDNAVNEGCSGCGEGQQQECGEGGDSGECEWGTQSCIDEGSGPLWGECQGGVRPVEEICDGLDNDCDENIDEGIAPDSYEDNDRCLQARGPLEVAEEDILELGATLYKPDGSQDEDWFFIDNNESELDLCVIPGSKECNFYQEILFAPPPSSPHEDWEVCLYFHEDEDDCATTILEEHCSTGDDWNEAEQLYELTVGWPGECWFEDGRNAFVVVRAVGSASASSCQEYQISFSFFYLDEDECIAE